MTRDVAVVVVTHNSAAEIDACLESLQNVAEIVVVDNGSADQTCRLAGQHRRGVRLIANPENRGFAAAANQGVRATASPLVLFLNPDAAVAGGLQPLAEQLEDRAVGAAAGRLVDAAGRTQVGFNIRAFPTPAALALEALLVNRAWPGNPVNRRYRRLDLDYSRAQDVEQPAGAFLMVRRDVLEAVGGWDERFFPLWFEDVDLCRRVRQAGYRIRYEPAAVARHRGAHSLARISLEQRQIYWYGSLLSYTDKHFAPLGRTAVRAAVLAGAWLRMVAAPGRGESWRIYGKVMGLALKRRPATAERVQPHVLT
ncbi:MAG TPA: glycosyltransferase family 2 protein [Bryobacterales bacterium]|nr:glycosyltransferase family 2 protein [Bryobacterales bacterium]